MEKLQCVIECGCRSLCVREFKLANGDIYISGSAEYYRKGCGKSANNKIFQPCCSSGFIELFNQTKWSFHIAQVMPRER